MLPGVTCHVCQHPLSSRQESPWKMFSAVFISIFNCLNKIHRKGRVNVGSQCTVGHIVSTERRAIHALITLYQQSEGESNVCPQLDLIRHGMVLSTFRMAVAMSIDSEGCIKK